VAHAVLARNFELAVHPAAFLVHQPHIKSAAQAGHDEALPQMAGRKAREQAADKFDGSAALAVAHVKHMDRLFFTGIRAIMGTGRATVVHDPQVQACLSNLTWWSGHSVLM
jgi:hypothetical protein